VTGHRSRWCDHHGTVGENPVCSHLQVPTGECLLFRRWYIGKGLDADLLCPACATERQSGQRVTTRDLCEACFRVTIDGWGETQGANGAAEIRSSPQPLDHRIEPTELDVHAIADIAVARDLVDTTFVLTSDLRIHRLEIGKSLGDPLASVAPLDEPHRENFSGQVSRPKLHVSHDGDFAAIVNNYGRFGTVVDLRSGCLTMALDDGDYHAWTVPFSLAFAELDSRTVLVHRSAWNRLDISDPTDGTLLTGRGPTSYRKGEEEPLNYLDYFHGALYLSPDGLSILDDGWVWHPVGMPVTWSLSAWLSTNPWESESGASLRHVLSRGYYWDHGFCWIDNHRIAVEGIGEDDDEIIPGVRIFDLSQIDNSNPRFPHARETAAFAGPTGRLFADGDRLFSSDAEGLAVWNTSEGALTGRIADFTPTIQCIGGRTLSEAKGSTIRRWHY